jgi:FMN hydrolase / 5-amino-6-(5-phospho-D-ribitylamino)uracil phosphatase
MKHIKAISLDLDETLWPVWPAIARAEQALHQFLQTHAPRTAAAYTTESLRALRDEVLANTPDLKHDIARIRLTAIGIALERTNHDRALAAPAWDAFCDERQRVEFFPGALGALEWLAARYPVVSLTNGNADVARIGIGHHFRSAITAGDVGVAKPDAAIFQIACERLGCEPAQVLHVGDDALLDVVGAKRAGLAAVWINATGAPFPHPEQPDLEFVDVAAMVRHLEAAG